MTTVVVGGEGYMRAGQEEKEKTAWELTFEL